MSDAPSDTTYGGRDNLEAMKKATRYNRFLVELIQQHAVGKQVLDHGAGAGTFAEPVAASNFDVLCMEPDETLRRDLGSKGFSVAATLSDVADASIDYAYTLNVLEHIQGDREALDDLYRCLKPGGVLLVYVPAFQVLFSQMDKHVGHFRRYRRQPLCNVLQNVGFDTEKARYVDSLGFLATLVYKLIGDRSGSVSAGSVSFYDALVFPVSRIIDILSFGSFGKNLLVVALKPNARPNE